MQTPPRRLSTVLIGVLVLGCAALTLRPPSVTLVDMQVIDANLFEQRFGFTLRLQNPNDADISVTGLTFEVELNDQSFAKGVSNKAATLPRLGEALLEVTAVSGLSGILRQINEMITTKRSDVSYRIRGRLVTGSFGDLPFDERGSLTLPRAAGNSPAGPSPPVGRQTPSF